jgi:hypothetical protein
MPHFHSSFLDPRQEYSTPAYDHLGLEGQEYQEGGNFLPTEGHKHPDSSDARPLRPVSNILTNFLVDLGCISVCLALFVLAMLAYRANGSTLGSYERTLIDTAKIVGGSIAQPLAALTILGYDCIPLHIRLHPRTMYSKFAELAT